MYIMFDLQAFSARWSSLSKGNLGLFHPKEILVVQYYHLRRYLSLQEDAMVSRISSTMMDSTDPHEIFRPEGLESHLRRLSRASASHSLFLTLDQQRVEERAGKSDGRICSRFVPLIMNTNF